VNLTPANLRRHVRLLYQSVHLLPHYQRLVGRLRMFWYIKLRRRLSIVQSDRAFAATIDHNLKSLRYFNQRTEALIRPLSVIETLGPESRLLIVGPRNEGDLFAAIGYGFSPKNVRGLDLISYSPMIDIGDMHQTPYADDSFDAIVVGWTLSYSSDPQSFATEMLRIVRDGGILAIGVEYSELTEEDTIALVGYRIDEEDKLPKRINSTADILSLFGDHVAHVFFDHDAPNKRSHTRAGLIENASAVCVIFSVRKSVSESRVELGAVTHEALAEHRP